MIALFLAAAVAAHPAPQRFDLLCNGTEQVGLDGTPTAASFELRVDLASGQFCYDQCRGVSAIKQVLADRLVLMDEDVDQPSKRETSEYYVNRVTGEYSGRLVKFRPIASFFERKGKCSPAPFKPFPKALF